MCYCSAARWYARPAWAVRSVVWPIFCHGYKKAELKNECVAFFFFSPKPSQILLWEEAAMGRKHLHQARNASTSPRVGTTAVHPPAQGQRASQGTVTNHTSAWKHRGMSETAAWPKALIFNAAVRPVGFPEMWLLSLVHSLRLLPVEQSNAYHCKHIFPNPSGFLNAACFSP